MGLCFSKPSSDSPAHPHYQQLPKRNHPPLPPPPYHPTPHSASSSSSSHTHQVGPVLGKPYFDIRTLYTLDKELGRGQFGITYLCTDKLTGLKYACKSISRRKLSSRRGIEDVKKEIMILQHLTGQPNVVEFKGAYEDWHHVHMVMELCSGGELFDRIIAKGLYSEDEAAVIFRQVLNVVHVCHFMGVIHRDLKPENFLLATSDPNSPLKAMDFGLSVFIEPGKVERFSIIKSGIQHNGFEGLGDRQDGRLTKSSIKRKTSSQASKRSSVGK